MLKDSHIRYGIISKILHWTMALLIIWQLLKLGDRIRDGEHWIGENLVPWHVSIGAVIMLMVLLRLLWLWTQRHQRPKHPPAQAKLIKTGHALLYVGLFIMPILGVLYLIGHGYPFRVFGIEVIAPGEEIAWAQQIGQLHSPVAWVMTALILGHIFMALHHHFVKRDDTLKRML